MPKHGDRAGEVVEIPPQAVERHRDRVDLSAGLSEVARNAGAVLIRDQTHVALRLRETNGVPVDEQKSAADGQQVRRMWLTVRDNRVGAPGCRCVDEIIEAGN